MARVASSSRFPLSLTFVLKPDGDGFYFPITSDKWVASDLSVGMFGNNNATERAKKKKRTHTCYLLLPLLHGHPVRDVNFGERGFQAW